jgi:YDG domain
VANDAFTVDLSNLSVAFADKNAGLAKALVISGASMGGADAGNYRVSMPNASADISPRDLHVSAANKVYDGTLLGGLVDDRVLGDGLTLIGSASFADAHAGLAKTVSLSGIGASGSDALNYRLVVPASGQADITARLLSVAANNVIRLAGEADPSPFTYASGAGEIMAGDSPVSIAAPSGSATASGGEVLRLHPVLNNPDYVLRSAADGYVLVIPQPADLSVDNQGTTRNVLAVEVDAQLRALALQELQRQQTEWVSHLGVAAPPPGPRPAPQVAVADPQAIRRLGQQISQASLGDSATLLNSLRSQPVLQWRAAQVPELLNVMETHE